MYDIILINPTVEEYKEFKTRFPIAKKAEDFRHAQRLAITEFFWVVWNDCKINKDFDFDFIPDEWSKEYIHVFKNGNNFDGLAMVPKTAVVTDREIEHRFFINKKEVDILTSNPKSFDLFYADTYEEYLYAYENSKTEMFWISSKNIKHEENLVKEFYISHHDTPLRKQTHAFIHKVKGENLYNGLFLCTKNYKLSKATLCSGFFIDLINSTFKILKGLHQRPISPFDLIYFHVNKAPNHQGVFVMPRGNFPVKPIVLVPCLSNAP
jgi:hypothetical protein